MKNPILPGVTVAQAAQNIKDMARRMEGHLHVKIDRIRRHAHIEKAFPGSDVRLLEYGKGDALRLPNGKLHTTAQSIRGFYKYVYASKTPGKFFLLSCPTANGEEALHPVAVLSVRDTPDEQIPATSDEIIRHALNGIADDNERTAGRFERSTQAHIATIREALNRG